MLSLAHHSSVTSVLILRSKKAYRYEEWQSFKVGVDKLRTDIGWFSILVRVVLFSGRSSEMCCTSIHQFKVIQVRGNVTLRPNTLGFNFLTCINRYVILYFVVQLVSKCREIKLRFWVSNKRDFLWEFLVRI